MYEFLMTATAWALSGLLTIVVYEAITRPILRAFVREFFGKHVEIFFFDGYN